MLSQRCLIPEIVNEYFFPEKERLVRACDSSRFLMRDDPSGIQRFHLAFIAMAEISGTII